MGDGEVLFVRGTVTSADGAPLPERGDRHLADRPERRLRPLGRAPARRTTSAVASASREDGRVRVPDDGPQAVHRADGRAVGRYLEAVGQHPWRPAHIHFKVTAAGHEPLVTQVFFPDDPYLENDTIGAVKAALVRPLERHDGSERGLDAPFSTCDFDIRLRPGRR